MGWNDLPLQQVFDLICSFPLLENLRVATYGHDKDEDISRPSVLPTFTGTLVLGGSAGGFVHQLSRPLTPLHFRKIVLEGGNANQFEGANDLVKNCSGTLEFIDVEYPESEPGESSPLSPANRSCSVFDWVSIRSM